MALIVQKYGGTSVADPERIRAVAEHVAFTKRRGNDVVVVVSAMGKSTDNLIKLANDVSRTQPGREMDMLITGGEIKAIALVAMALHDQGIEAASFSGGQAGFITDTNHQNAKILDLRTEEGKAAFLELVRDADAVVEAMRPGGLDRRGLGFDVLRTVNPKIVFCTISGYGMTGPYRDMPSHGIAYDAWAGIVEPETDEEGFAYMPEHTSIGINAGPVREDRFVIVPGSEIMAILCLSLYTSVKAAFLSTVFATLTEERNMIYLSPLMLIGTAMVFVGIVASSVFKLEKQQGLEPGGTVEIGPYTLRYDGVRTESDPHVDKTLAQVFAGVIDELVGTVLATDLQLLGTRGRGDHACAERLADLDGGQRRSGRGARFRSRGGQRARGRPASSAGAEQWRSIAGGGNRLQYGASRTPVDGGTLHRTHQAGRRPR